MLFRGWAAALRSDIARGLGDMREALASAEVACSPSDFRVYYEMFADVYERAGRFDEGLNAVNECLAHAEYAGRVYWNAELHRRRGELMCAAGADPSAVTDRFENALTDARAQMRCSSCCAPRTSLARLRLDEGRVSDPGRMLTRRLCRPPPPPDLRDARALLATTP